VGTANASFTWNNIAQPLTTGVTNYLVVVSVSPGATSNAKIVLRMSEGDGSIVLGTSSPQDTVVAGYSETSAVYTVGDKVVVNAPGDSAANINRGTNDKGTLRFSLAVDQGSGSADLGQVKVVTAAANTAVYGGLTPDFSNVRLYVDVNNNGEYDSGTDTAVSGTFSDGGAGASTSFTWSGITGQTLTSTPTDYLLVVDVDAGAVFNSKIVLEVADSVPSIALTGTTDEVGTPYTVTSPVYTIFATGDVVTVGTLADSTEDLSKGTADKGTLRFALQVTGNNDDGQAALDQVKVVTAAGNTAIYAGGTPDFDNVRLFVDADNDGNYDNGSDPAVTGTFSATGADTASASFTWSGISGQTINTGLTSYLVVVDVAANAASNAKIALRASEGDGSITLGTSAPQDTLAAGYSETSPDYVVGDTVNAGNLADSDEQLQPDTLDKGTLRFSLAVDSGAGAAGLSAVTVVTDLANTAIYSGATPDFDNVRLYVDVNSNGEYDSGTDTAVSGTFSDGGAGASTSFTWSGITGQALSTTPTDYLVVVDISAAAVNNNQIVLKISDTDSSIVLADASDAVATPYSETSAVYTGKASANVPGPPLPPCLPDGSAEACGG
jgi:hypothetical protein